MNVYFIYVGMVPGYKQYNLDQYPVQILGTNITHLLGRLQPEDGISKKGITCEEIIYGGCTIVQL